MNTAVDNFVFTAMSPETFWCFNKGASPEVDDPKNFIGYVITVSTFLLLLDIQEIPISHTSILLKF